MTDDEKFKDFASLEFPSNINAVYIIHFAKDNEEVPFYVGETSRFLGRISDYIAANFKAPTDFKVGEAIKYFQEKGYGVVIKYKPSEDRKEDEKEIIKLFQDSGTRLLNELIGFDYKKANEAEERERIRKFCDNITFGIGAG